MLTILSEFRGKLDNIMLKCMYSRIAIYGYDSYTGRFLKWYASYYHGIEVDWLISEDMSTGRGYDREVFRPSVFDFEYKDIKNTVIWLAQPVTDELREKLASWGYIDGRSYYDFYREIYGMDTYAEVSGETDVFIRKKEGKRDIQFLEWVEWKYGCNFLTPIAREDFEVVDVHGSRYSCSTQKEIFPILDRCHVHPSKNDAIFDYGCGKGGALVTFLDYGFVNVGGVEYEPKTYKICVSNLKKIGADSRSVICGDARNIKTELDGYNWFYFFFPFDISIFSVVIDNIKASYVRKKRKITIIYFTAMEHRFIEETGIFRLVNQFTVDSRQRVVGIFETY